MAINPAPATASGTPSWSTGAKDTVTGDLPPTIRATVATGILTEVFWPRVDQPQTKDLGFLVADADRPGATWCEVKAVDDYVVTPHADPAVPLATVTHTGDFYRLELRVVPTTDAVLVAYDLSGTGAPLTLYPLLAPHLGRCTAGAWTGTDNVAWSEDGALLARDGADQHFLCLLAEPGFSATSVGYVGSSDGWTDLAQHQQLTWGYDLAGPGTVALTGKLPAGAGVLALGFGLTAAAARQAAQNALDAGVGAAETAVTQAWQARSGALTFPAPAGGVTAAMVDAVRQSATTLQLCEDPVSGAIVAGLATPWGDETNDPGGYHMVWCRDGCETALALAALGDVESGRRLLGFLQEHQNQDAGSPDFGSWARCYFLDGSSLSDLQLDQVAFPILLAAKLAELGSAASPATEQMVRAAATYLMRRGPVSGDDRWEETFGASPFAVALVVVALVAAAQTMTGDERAYALSLADNWNERIEEFSYVEGGELDRAFDTAGHYVRIGSASGQVRLGNQLQSDTTVAAEAMVGMEFLYLARLGLRDPLDSRITDTLTVVDQMLSRTTDSGETFARYDMDGYGEWLDGSGWPRRGFGIGRPWPLLAGERGHYDALAGVSPVPRLEAMLSMRGRGGLLPEQVWDTGDLPWRQLRNGRPTRSAMPLAWAHSELVKLVVTTATSATPVERLTAVQDRWGGTQPASTQWHWRTTMPVRRLPADCSLLVEDSRPFTLHLGFDDWQPDTVTDREATVLPFGLFGVELSVADLAGHQTLQLTRHFQDGWEGADHAVVLNAERPATLRLARRHQP